MCLVFSRKSLVQEKESKLTGRKTQQEAEGSGLGVGAGPKWCK